MIRPFFCASLALLCSLLVAACQSERPPQADENVLQIAVIPKSVGFDFWANVKSGADAAADSLGNVEVIWKGTNDETDIAGQVAIVESFIINQVDALVIAASDAQGLVPVLRQAIDAGITVITIDSNTSPQVSSAFIATDNQGAAEMAADMLAEQLGESGKVALIPYIAGASTSNDRETGFKRGLAKYPDLELVATQYSNSDYGRALQVTEDILTAHPDLNGIFAANEPSVLGAAQALKTRNLTDQVVLIGFDASPREIDELRAGTVDGLVVQNPFRMGYEGVVRAVHVINGRPVPEVIDSGVQIMTPETVTQE
jgi:ribose transport system substrate-binding protein